MHLIVPGGNTNFTSYWCGSTKGMQLNLMEANQLISIINLIEQLKKQRANQPVPAESQQGLKLAK